MASQKADGGEGSTVLHVASESTGPIRSGFVLQPEKAVEWTPEVVDNEHLGRKKSKSM